MDVSIISDLWNTVPDEVKATFAVIGVNAVLGMLIPNPGTARTIAYAIVRAINIGGFNFWQAKNKK